jgi:hypothetical protein
MYHAARHYVLPNLLHSVLPFLHTIGKMKPDVSLMQSEWTKERNMPSGESIKGILLGQYNFRNKPCE